MVNFYLVANFAQVTVFHSRRNSTDQGLGVEVTVKIEKSDP